MTIRVIDDQRDAMGHGHVLVEADKVGRFQLTFGDSISPTTRWPYPGFTVSNRTGYHHITQGPVPQVQLTTTRDTMTAPRSKFRPNGGVRYTITPNIEALPSAVLQRGDFRLLGTSGTSYYKDKMMSDPMWRSWLDDMTPLMEWIVQNKPRSRPVVNPSLVSHHDVMKRNAQSARDRWQAAERDFLAARDALAREEERVAAALAAA